MDSVEATSAVPCGTRSRDAVLPIDRDRTGEGPYMRAHVRTHGGSPHGEAPAPTGAEQGEKQEAMKNQGAQDGGSSQPSSGGKYVCMRCTFSEPCEGDELVPSASAISFPTPQFRRKEG